MHAAPETRDSRDGASYGRSARALEYAHGALWLSDARFARAVFAADPRVADAVMRHAGLLDRAMVTLGVALSVGLVKLLNAHGVGEGHCF